MRTTTTDIRKDRRDRPPVCKPDPGDSVRARRRPARDDHTHTPPHGDPLLRRTRHRAQAR